MVVARFSAPSRGELISKRDRECQNEPDSFIRRPPTRYPIHNRMK